MVPDFLCRGLNSEVLLRAPAWQTRNLYVRCALIRRAAETVCVALQFSFGEQALSRHTHSIMWFREDLRLTDNPALHAASAAGLPVCVFIRADRTKGIRPMGGAATWWLDKSLRALGDEISRRGGQLLLRTGDPLTVLRQLATETGATRIFWNRRYDLAEREADAAVKTALRQDGFETESHNGRLLAEPWEIKTGSGGPYRVFTPFWKALKASYQPPQACPAPEILANPGLESEDLESWGLHPSRPDWSTGFSDVWAPGETGARDRLQDFLDGPVANYADHRNRPDLEQSTSRLSPHLRFGEISPAQIWRAVTARIESGDIPEKPASVFLSEVGWREFSYVLLYHNPDLARVNYNPAFGAIPWRESESDYEAWCRGETGYPIVDAGMRQLWTTGWMHNRVRMIVASFLTKHLLIPWQKGEKWFWDTLVDADPASNAASWQWTAGSGADAAPYFRVFNPITQGQKFDETGNYVRQWCPELKTLAHKHLHAPFEADRDTLAAAGLRLGQTYPKPVVGHNEGRERALNAYEQVKQQRENS
jgi:deoxyribodipyrimidine photo-lyase